MATGKLRFLCALDSFKDCQEAKYLSDGLCSILQRLYTTPACSIPREISTVSLPLSDGGEGFLSALAQVDANPVMPKEAEQIRNALGQKVGPCMCGIYSDKGSSETKKRVLAKVSAGCGYCSSSYVTFGEVAYIEMARVSGLEAVPEKLRNPDHTTTFGTGQLLQDAYQRGFRKMVVGLGGSATNDGGLGALQALGVCAFEKKDAQVQKIPIFYGKHLSVLDHVELPQEKTRLWQDVKVKLACDVDNPFLGPNGAVHVFSKQKGATDEKQRDVLESGMKRLADEYLRCGGRSVHQVPGAGAAGGLAGGLFALLEHVEIQSGLEIISDILQLRQAIKNCDVVFTGEGCFDSQTSRGKVVSQVCKLASEYGKKVVIFCGKNETKLGPEDGVLEFLSSYPLEKSLSDPLYCMEGLLQKHWKDLSLEKD